MTAPKCNCSGGDPTISLGADLEMRHLLTDILAQLDAALGLLLPRCSRCLHPITAPESVKAGMGPTCRRTA